MRIWDPINECMSRDELETLQLTRLHATLERVLRNVACYRQQVQRSWGSTPDDIRTLADLSRLPFTTKEDLRLNYPYGMFAVPMREVVRIHSSSGTTGKPTVVGYTRHDLRDLDRTGGPIHDCRRGHRGRYRPYRLRIRALHRRLRPALRSGADRRLGHSHVQRQHG